MKKIKKIASYFLIFAMIFYDITPSLAHTYKDSTANEEYQDIEVDTESSNTTVYAEVGSAFKVTIPKHIILDGTTKTGGYAVTVTGDIAGTEVISVTPDKSFALSSNNLADVSALISQDKISWEYNEILENSNILGNGIINASEITAGSWNGNFNFNIKLTEVSVSVKAENSDGKDLNANAKNIIEDKKEMLLDELNNSGLANSDEIDALIEVSSDDFDNLAKTIFDVSNIANPGEQVTVLHYDEETNEWEYISTETVADDGTITVYMDSYSPVAFLKVENGEPKHVHIHNITIKESTCTENGLKTFTCYCGDVYTEEIELSDHIWETDFTVDNESTCTKPGSKSIHCKNCTATKDTEEIPATGHSYSSSKCTKCGSLQPNTYTVSYGYTGGMQSFTAPEDGIYKFECWGARGGVALTNYSKGGKGGYVYGYKEMKAGETLYICVGGKGGDGNTTQTKQAPGGYNGGGAGGMTSGFAGSCGGGGGATSVSTANTTIAGNPNACLLVAGGGGGGGQQYDDGGNGGGASNTLNGSKPASGGSSFKVPTPTEAGYYYYGSINKYFYSKAGQGLSGWPSISEMSSAGGGGGGRFGGPTMPWKGGCGGSGYIAGMPTITFNGVTYAAGYGATNNGNGAAKVTFIISTQ